MEHPSADDVERGQIFDDIAALVQQLEALTVPAVTRSLADLDLTLQQVKVLTVLLTAEDGVPIRELAETFGVSTASVSMMVDRLVMLGVARRQVDPGDQRVRRIHVTPSGRTAIQKVFAARPEYAPDVLRMLAVRDLTALLQGLRAVVAAQAEITGNGAPS